MKKQKLEISEERLANSLRDELFKVSMPKKQQQKQDLSQMELIAPADKAYISPIFSMNEDEVLAFVEEFDVKELATLSVSELNHLGKVLGVDPKILVEGED